MGATLTSFEVGVQSVSSRKGNSAAVEKSSPLCHAEEGLAISASVWSQSFRSQETPHFNSVVHIQRRILKDKHLITVFLLWFT